MWEVVGGVGDLGGMGDLGDVGGVGGRVRIISPEKSKALLPRGCNALVDDGVCVRVRLQRLICDVMPRSLSRHAIA